MQIIAVTTLFWRRRYAPLDSYGPAGGGVGVAAPQNVSHVEEPGIAQQLLCQLSHSVCPVPDESQVAFRVRRFLLALQQVQVPLDGGERGAQIVGMSVVSASGQPVRPGRQRGNRAGPLPEDGFEITEAAVCSPDIGHRLLQLPVSVLVPPPLVPQKPQVAVEQGRQTADAAVPGAIRGMSVDLGGPSAGFCTSCRGARRCSW